MKILNLVLLVGIMSCRNVTAEETYNIAPECRLSSIPYVGPSLNRLIDGDTPPDKAGFNGNPDFPRRSPQTAICIGASVTFTFPVTKKVKSIRFFCMENSFEGANQKAGRSFSITDETGRLLGETEKKSLGWNEIILPTPHECSSLTLHAHDGQEGIYFGVSEVEIMAVGKKTPRNETAAAAARNSIRIKTWKPLKDTSLEEDLLKRAIYFFGITSISNEMAKKIRSMGINTVIVYVHTYAEIGEKGIDADCFTLPQEEKYHYYYRRGLELCRNAKIKRMRVVTWPSEIVLGTRTNHLKKACNIFHAHGIKVIASNVFALPFDPYNNYGHGGQNDWHGGHLPPAPCLISDPFLKELGKKLIGELLANGVDGIVLGNDEFYAEGHRLSALSPHDPCVAGYFRTSGLKSLPVKAENTPEYRQWKMMEYEGIAGLFKEWTKEMKRLAPKSYATALLLPGPWYYTDRLTYNLPYDMLGRKSGMDSIGTDYYRPMTMPKLLAASSASGKASYTWLLGKFSPYQAYMEEIDMNGVMLAALGQLGKGLSSIELWENRHVMTFSGKDTPDTKRGEDFLRRSCYLLKRLQKEGICNATVPGKNLLLYSRASEDWWQLKHGYEETPSPSLLKAKYGLQWQKLYAESISKAQSLQSLEQMTGFIRQQAFLDMLTARVIPHEIRYLDQPDSLCDIDSADNLIIPFAYSLPEYSAEQIVRAAKMGKNIILADHLGELDEGGAMRMTPALLSLRSMKNVHFIHFDACDGSDDLLAKKILPLLKQQRMLKLQFLNSRDIGGAYGFILENKNRYFLTLVNYLHRGVPISIRLPKKGKRLQIFDTNGIAEAEVPDSLAFPYEIPERYAVVFVIDL